MSDEGVTLIDVGGMAVGTSARQPPSVSLCPPIGWGRERFGSMGLITVPRYSLAMDRLANSQRLSRIRLAAGRERHLISGTSGASLVRRSARLAVIVCVTVLFAACTSTPDRLQCVEVTQADCLTARMVASGLVGVAPESVYVVVRRYRPDFESLGKPNPDFAAHVAITRSGNESPVVVLVMRQTSGGQMTGQLVGP